MIKSHPIVHSLLFGTNQSFSAVVLFLKTLLTHHSLDAPFTGGLGSYKLYVLVAHHMERHLSLGGSDRPGEIILSFLFRYGMSSGSVAPRGKQQRHQQRHFTTLKQSMPLDGPNGGCADLSNVFRLDDCIELFQQCFYRLWEKIVWAGRQQPQKNGRHATTGNDTTTMNGFDHEEMGMTTERQRVIQASLFKMLGQTDDDITSDDRMKGPT